VPLLPPQPGHAGLQVREDDDGQLQLYLDDGRPVWGTLSIQVNRNLDVPDRATVELYLTRGEVPLCRCSGGQAQSED
jgi:hypothetical protein